MYKIIAAFDGLKYSASTTQYALKIAKTNKAHLVGVFLEDFTYHSYKITELAGDEGFDMEKAEILKSKDYSVRQRSIQHFIDACTNAQISYTVHQDKNIAIQELLKESIFADLLIIGKDETLIHYAENPPTNFIRSLLADVACPVLVVPDKYQHFDKPVFLYDGSPSSIHAMRTFSYLFKPMIKTEVEVVTVVHANRQNAIPDSLLLKEFMKHHFAVSTYTRLTGNPETAIMQYLNNRTSNSLVILGAYKRSFISRWFKHSMADVLMEELKVPLFIAHI